MLFVGPLIPLFWTSGDIYHGWHKDRVDPLLAYFLTCSILRFTSVMTLADCIEVHMATKSFWSMYLQIMCPQALLWIWTHDRACCMQHSTVNHLATLARLNKKLNNWEKSLSVPSPFIRYISNPHRVLFTFRSSKSHLTIVDSNECQNNTKFMSTSLNSRKNNICGEVPLRILKMWTFILFLQITNLF